MSKKKSVELLLSLLRAHSETPAWVPNCVELMGCVNSTSTVEKNIITQSYLDFLEEQIELQPRGVEWSQLLQRRRDAIAPHLNKEVTFFSIDGENENHISIYLDESAEAIINMELD